MTDIIAKLTGQSWTSEWLLIDQPLIDRFAEATGDFQFIHIDPVRAAETPFGGTIAHGFLLLSLLPRLVELSAAPAVPGTVLSINYGFDRVRFTRPVRSGSRIRARFVIAEVIEKAPGRFQQTLDVEIDTQGQEKPAVIARWLGQFVVAPAAAGAADAAGAAGAAGTP